MRRKTSRRTRPANGWLSHRLPDFPDGALLALIALFGLVLLVGAGCTPTGSGTGAGTAGGGTTIRPTTTPPPLETPGPLPTPGTAHGIPAIQPTLNGVPAFTTDAMSRYALNHPLEGLIGSHGTPSVNRDEFLPSEVVGSLLNVPTNQPDGTLLGYVELKGDFTFAGPVRDQPLHFPYSYHAFDAATGNLVLSGGLNQPTPKTPPATPTPGPQQPTPSPTPQQPAPTPTPQQPTATPIPPKLSVTPTKADAFCANGGWPKFTVKNIGGGTLNWNISSTLPPKLSASPSSGSLGAGASQDIVFSGTINPPPAGFTISFSSNGGTQVVPITCK